MLRQIEWEVSISIMELIQWITSPKMLLCGNERKHLKSVTPIIGYKSQIKLMFMKWNTVVGF